MSLYRVFKSLAFRSLCLVPNEIGFVLTLHKYLLNLLSKRESQKLENFPNSCFSISVKTVLYLKIMQVSSAQSNKTLAIA